MRHLPVFATAALIALTASPAFAQATRTWVSGVGADDNPCSRTAPCKTFAGALIKTAPGGEISVLDPGGFGTINITKAISVNGEWGGEGGVLAANTTGIIVNAGANDVVNIRGLMIEGAGNGINGIRYLAGKALHVQNTVIRNFKGASANNHNGILVNPTTGNLILDVSDTVIADNGPGGAGVGIHFKPTGAATIRASITRTQVMNNTIGLNADGDNGTGSIDVTITDSVFARNAGDGVATISPNASDALVKVTLDRATVSSNGAIGVHSVGQRSTVRITKSTVTANGAAGLQANNSGVLGSYGDNATEGNGAVNAGVTPAPPS
jgi:hypothetical protein